ncbi:MAG: hypothetical protein ABGY29_06340, partial [bacterium]
SVDKGRLLGQKQNQPVPHAGMRRQIAEAQTQITHLREIGYPWPTQKKQDPLLGIMKDLAAQHQSIYSATSDHERQPGILGQRMKVEPDRRPLQSKPITGRASRYHLRIQALQTGADIH